MSRSTELRFESLLAADRRAVWDVISTPAGINAELWPWLRMTFPPGVERLTPETVPLGRRLCRSWVLLGGVLPIDYDDVTLLAVDPPRGFEERSRMLTSRVWAHRRTLEVRGAGCLLVDVVGFEPRVGLLRPVVRRVVGAVFGLRHRNLRRRFGAGDEGGDREGAPGIVRRMMTGGSA